MVLDVFCPKWFSKNLTKKALVKHSHTCTQKEPCFLITNIEYDKKCKYCDNPNGILSKRRKFQRNVRNFFLTVSEWEEGRDSGI